jgi:hypothetical protein
MQKTIEQLQAENKELRKETQRQCAECKVLKLMLLRRQRCSTCNAKFEDELTNAIIERLNT